MRYKYDISFEDFMELQKMYIMKNNQYIMRLRWVFPLALFLLSLVSGLYTSLYSWVTAGIVIALWFILTPTLLYKIQLHKIRSGLWKQDTSLITGIREIEIHDAGFKTISNLSEQFFKWEAVKQIEEEGDKLFILVGLNYWVIVVFRKHEKEEENKAFYRQLKSRLQDSLHG